MAVKYYVLLQGDKDTNHVFTGSSPRRAALKAATRGFKDIKLRERGTDRLHIFKGSRKKVPAPENAPEWLPSQIWKPVVKKVKLVHLKENKKQSKKR
ncbi:MAG: non-histone chromosomal MC1 family protein [Candidatus Nanoarchaeia archaeon]